MAVGISANDLEITWNPSLSPDIHHYNIYKSNDPNTFNFLTPWHDTTGDPDPLACAWTDINAGSDSQSHFYVVRAVDYAMNEDQNTGIFGKYYRPVDPSGYNLVSMPLIQQSTNIDDVLMDTAWEHAVWYDATDTDKWRSNGIFKPGFLNDLTDIDRTMGVWLKTTSSDRMVVTGTVPSITQIDLLAGWNLVSYPSFTAKTVADALQGTGYTRVECGDPGMPYDLKEMLPTEMMNAGEGYWVQVPGDTMWVVDW